jgi:hypothetical protein
VFQPPNPRDSSAVLCCLDTKDKTTCKLTSAAIDEQSALLNIPNEKPFPVDANHRTLCKILSAENQEYGAVGAWIADLARSVATNTSLNLRTLP